MPQVEIQQNAQHIRGTVNRKRTGDGAVGVMPVHIVVAQLTGKENDIAGIQTPGINIVNIGECFIAVGMKGAVKVVIGDDFVDGFQEPKGADNGNGDHNTPPCFGTNQKLSFSIAHFQESAIYGTRNKLTNMTKTGRIPIVFFVYPCYNESDL